MRFAMSRRSCVTGFVLLSTAPPVWAEDLRGMMEAENKRWLAAFSKPSSVSGDVCEGRDSPAARRPTGSRP
jgi:hypothetical protein